MMKGILGEFERGGERDMGWVNRRMIKRGYKLNVGGEFVVLSFWAFFGFWIID